MAVYKDKIRNTWYYEGKYTNYSGERVYYKKRGFSRKNEATEAERIFLIEVNSNPLCNFTFEELSIEYQNYMKTRRKGSTIHTNETHLKIINNIIGHKKYEKIMPKDIVNIQNYMINKGNSVKYINEVFGTAKKVMNYAKKMYNLNYNPCDNVERLQNETIIDNIVEIKFWTQEEFNKAMDKADNIVFKTLYYFLYYTGVRKGEALALNWHDINLKNKTVFIKKTLTRKLLKEYREDGKKYLITLPKSKNSIREITLPDILIEVMQDYYHYCKKQDGFNDDLFVFGLFQPLPDRNIDRKLNKYAKEANVPLITPHGLRHSHVSYLINNGINVLAVAARAGDTVEIILKVYAHLFKEKDDEIISLLNKSTPKVRHES